MIEFRIENELITQIELEEFEQKLNGLKLPDDYKQHMLQYNGGGTIEDYIYGDMEDIHFFGFLPIKHEDHNMESSLIARTDVLPESDIYIGDIRGGSLCMSLGKDHGAIYAFFSDGERIDLAASFTEFIVGLQLLDEE